MNEHLHKDLLPDIRSAAPFAVGEHDLKKE
ncbi:hypothetical protein J2T58_001711 [Methanocalculus alkaliphilus]|nr:hypothetical protein [Methanocalculus alkaliphilus]